MAFPEHFRKRMGRRGVSVAEVEIVLERGWPCGRAREGRECKVFVFVFNAVWDGKWYAEKEMTLFYKFEGEELILITVNTRFGDGFPRE